MRRGHGRIDAAEGHRFSFRFLRTERLFSSGDTESSTGWKRSITITLSDAKSTRYSRRLAAPAFQMSDFFPDESPLPFLILQLGPAPPRMARTPVETVALTY